MNPIDFSDVQGLAAFGYAKLVEASILLLRVRDPQAAREWLSAVAPLISTAEFRDTPPDAALQIAFTPSGLCALGVAEAAIAGFSTEFLQGMNDPNRSRRLGDSGANDPSQWAWGGGGAAIDIAVLIFAKQNLEGWQRQIQQSPWEQAFEIRATLPTSDMGGHEPFGFRDGISQPEFDWKREEPFQVTTTEYKKRLAIGELLLGYPNEYEKYNARPLLDPSADPENLLPFAEDDPALKDLGCNGTYVVLRQLEQDVRGFWQFLDHAANGDAAERYRLGAAMVGRDVSGTPLIPAPANPAGPANDFVYDGDPSGTQCPLGAHVRRANPRNADLFGHPSGVIAGGLSRIAIPRPKMSDDLIASARFHCILRRGREYGELLNPDDATKPPTGSEQPRGLQFVALCANLKRQFEFVQSAWLMSTKFDGMTGESDPLLGNRAAIGDDPPAAAFSIPRNGKMARNLGGIPQFVTVRGASYFFLPGIRAVHYIAKGTK